MFEQPVAARRQRARGAAAIAALLLALTASVHVAGVQAQPAAADGAPPATLPAAEGRWFAIGANVPFVTWRCDFGCGLGGGVRGREAMVDRMLRDMSRRGVRTVRWYLFPGDAWQVRRAADGTPTGVAPAALLDLDRALHLARKHDVFLVPVVLPSPGAVPVTWFTEPEQARALARALRPMFARYRGASHLLAWELATGAEALADSGAASTAQLRSHVARLQNALDLVAPQLGSVGMNDVSRIRDWSGVGVDFYAPHFLSGMSGAACATCRTTGSLMAGEAADRPVVIGGFDAPTDAIGAQRIDTFTRNGYAGAWAWSWRGVRHPRLPAQRAPMPDDATWRYHHARPGSGPRSRPLNPCYGPSASLLRCPNLRMAPPTSVSLGRIGTRRVLFSTNSLDSVGAGPASLRGRRDGRLTMAAVQLLHRRGAAPVAVSTGAELLFKAIPGQYRYWKWNGAARMELWRLDSTGRAVQRARVGPKTVYCLRDLQRRNGRLPGSPRGRVYPACSQSLLRRDVVLGTSVGWSDVYPASYHENWIDVTGLRGCFAYVHVADPTNVIYESNEDDNSSKVVVRLPWTGSNAGCPGARAIPTAGATGIY